MKGVHVIPKQIILDTSGNPPKYLDISLKWFLDISQNNSYIKIPFRYLNSINFWIPFISVQCVCAKIKKCTKRPI